MRTEIELVSWDYEPRIEERVSVGTVRRAEQRGRRKRRTLHRRRLLFAMRVLAIVLVLELLVSFVSGRGAFAGGGLSDLAARHRSGSEASYGQGTGVSAEVPYGQGTEVSAPRAYSGREIRAELERLAEEEEAYRKILDNYDSYPEQLLASLCSNPELLPFVQGYLNSDGQAHGGLKEEELASAVPLLLQWDERWGYAAYGDSDIALSGCAPTCMSMVIVALTKNPDATPAEVADYAIREGYYVRGTGTSWSFMTEGGAHYGVSGSVLSLDEGVIKSRLASGHPIICSMRPGDFTTAGHFIVLAGVEDGKIIVNDPNSRARSSVLWDYGTLATQIKNLWVFSAD